jgi:hypothetical protein
VATRYYQLVSALPHVPHFRRAGRLTMSRRRLEQRLGLLEPADQADLRAAESLIAWSQQPVERSTRELADLYRRVTAGLRNHRLRALLAFRMDMRTVMVALRLRRRGIVPDGRVWGVSDFVRTIEARWGESDFGLSAVFPWIHEANVHLERGDAMALEGLLMDQSWKTLSQVAEQAPFGFEQVFATVFKLDILRRWLSYDADQARARFERLILEVTSDHQQLFP